eukprot:8711435-Ditylum_brightwellii.AAC.1
MKVTKKDSGMEDMNAGIKERPDMLKALFRSAGMWWGLLRSSNPSIAAGAALNPPTLSHDTKEEK